MAGRSVSGGSLPVDPTENVKALNEASSRHLREVVQIEFAGVRREIENQARLVAKTREIDRQNQDMVNDRLQAGTDALAAEIELTAKTLSASAAETARSIASQIDGTFGRLAERVAALERGQYEGTGRANVRDPQVEALMTEVRALRTEQSKETGKSAGLSMGAGILIAAVGLLATILSIAGAIMAFAPGR